MTVATTRPKRETLVLDSLIAELIFDPDRKDGNAFSFDIQSVDITNDDEQRIGALGSTPACGVSVTLYDEGKLHVYTIAPMVLFNAVLSAHAKRMAGKASP